MKEKRILITGGAGFIGSNLVRHLANIETNKIVVFDDESLGDRKNIGDVKHVFIKGDIRDDESLKTVIDDVDIIVHLAADTRVMDSIEDPVKNFEVNVIGTFNVLKLARKAGVKKVIIASTGGAILGEAEPPIHEAMVARPLSPYGASKLAAEGYASAFSAAYGMPVTCLRFSNIYGPGSFHKGSVVAHFFKHILNGEDLIVYGDGSQIRDYLFIQDLMKGIAGAMQSENYGVYQLGSGIPTSINELLSAIKSSIGSDFKSDIRFTDFRAGEVKHTWCNIDKARGELGFSPATTLLDGLVETWKWFNKVGSSAESVGE